MVRSLCWFKFDTELSYADPAKRHAITVSSNTAAVWTEMEKSPPVKPKAKLDVGSTALPGFVDDD